MNKHNKLVIFFITAILTIAGCRSNPVMNVSNTPVDVSTSASYKDIQRAIVAAGTSLGWVIKPVKYGHFEGTLFLRKHVAKVDIYFKDNTYSIKYKDSKNLDYDGTNIHSNYNGWVLNLSNSIRTQLSML